MLLNVFIEDSIPNYQNIEDSDFSDNSSKSNNAENFLKKINNQSIPNLKMKLKYHI
jgi:hypothetical protein